MQANRINKMKTKRQKLNEAINSLFLVVSEDVANNVKQVAQEAIKEASLELPSEYKPGETVALDFFKAGALKGCEVVAARFTKGKVKYDVAVLLIESTEEEMKDSGRWTVIKNVDSACVTKP